MKRPIIDYTEHGIPRCAIGGGTTKTRLTSRERRYLLRAAQREWARATIKGVREPYDRDSVWAHVDGVARAICRALGAA